MTVWLQSLTGMLSQLVNTHENTFFATSGFTLLFLPEFQANNLKYSSFIVLLPTYFLGDSVVHLPTWSNTKSGVKSGVTQICMLVDLVDLVSVMFHAWYWRRTRRQTSIQMAPIVPAVGCWDDGKHTSASRWWCCITKFIEDCLSIMNVVFESHIHARHEWSKDLADLKCRHFFFLLTVVFYLTHYFF